MSLAKTAEPAYVGVPLDPPLPPAPPRSASSHLVFPRPPSRSDAAALVLRASAVGSVLAYISAVPVLGPDAFAFPKELLLHACACASAALTLWRRPRLGAGTPEVLLALMLCLGIASGAVRAENGWQALRGATLAASAVVLLCVARQLAAEGYRTHLLASVGIAVVLAAGTGVLEAHGVLGHLSLQNRAPGGTLGNRNRMAHVLAIGLPLAVPLLVAARRRAHEWVVCAGVALVTTALVLSRCRAAWLTTAAVVAVGAGCLALALVRRRAGVGRWAESDRPLLARRHVAGLALAGVAGIASALLPPNALRWRSSSPYLDTVRRIAEYDSGSGRGRVVMYANTLAMVRDYPLLGVGPGNWAVQYPLYATPGDPSLEMPRASVMATNRLPSSDWLGVAAEWGVMALLLLASFAAVQSRRGWRLLRQAREARDAAGAAQGAAFLLTLGTLVTLGFLDSVLTLPTPALLAAIAVGALAPQGNPVALAFSRLTRRAALATAVGAAAAGAAYASLELWGGRAYSSARGPAGFARAARINPGDFRAHMRVASLWVRSGRCDLAGPFTAAAERLYPYSPAPKRLAAQCASPSLAVVDPSRGARGATDLGTAPALATLDAYRGVSLETPESSAK